MAVTFSQNNVKYKDENGNFVSIGDFVSNSMNNYCASSAFANMINVAESYFDRAYQNKDTAYQLSRGLFFDNLLTDNGKKSLICSELICAMLKGIYYNQSRYVRGVNSFNIQSDWAYEFEGLSDDKYTSNVKRRYLLSDDIAEYCDLKGYLKTVNKTNIWENDIRAGDLVFSGSKSGTFKNIGHVAMVVSVGRYTDNEGNINIELFVVESEDTATTIDGLSAWCRFHKYDLSSFGYYATLPVYDAPCSVDVAFTSDNLCNNADSLYKSDKMLNYGIYTLSLKGYCGTSNPNVKLMYNDGTVAIIEGCRNDNGVSDITFYAEKPFTWSLNHNVEDYEYISATMYKGVRPLLMKAV